MANNLYKIYVTSNNEWRELELDDLNLSTVFSVEEISDISQRKDNITKSITLKGTKQNNRVLGALYSIDRDVATDAVDPENLMYNYKPNKYIDCFVLENNVEIIRGKLLVTSIDVVEGVIYYNASIVGTVYSFFSLMADRKLEELDSFNVPSYRNISNVKSTIEASWSANNFNVAYDDSNTQYPNLIKDSKMERYVNYGTGGTLSDYDSDSTKVYRVDMNATAGAVFGIQTGQPDRTMSVVQGQTYTFSFKMRGNITTLNYAYLMRDSGSNMSVLITSLPNMDETIWNTYRVTFNAPFTASDAWVMTSYRNVSGVSGRFFEIKDIKLNSGAMTDNFTYNPDEFKYQPFVYPLIDYGGDMGAYNWTPFPAFRWDALRPAIFVYEYIKAIFRGFRLNSSDKWTQLEDDGTTLLNQFTLQSGLVEEEWFRRLIIPHNDIQWSKKVLGVTDGGDTNVLYRANLTTPALTSANKDTEGFRVANGSYTEAFSSQYFEIVTRNTPNNRVNGKDVRAIRVKAPFKGTIKVTGNVIKSASANRSSVVFVGKVDSTGTELGSNFLGDAPTGVSAGTTPFTIEIHNASIDNDIVIGVNSSSDATNFTLSGVQIKFIGEGGSGTDMGVQYGDTFNLFDAIPKDISIKDFLKNIMLMFNLYITVDKLDDTVLNLRTFDDFYRDVLNLDKSSALDWTDKIDWASYSINTNVDLPRGYTYKYNDDNDIMNVTYKRLWNETYGTRSVLDSSGLVEEKTVNPFFSPTLNFNWKGNLNVPIIYEGETLGIGERKPMKSNLRILYYSGEVNLTGFANDSDRMWLTDSMGNPIYEGGTLVTFDSVPYSGMNLHNLVTVDDFTSIGQTTATLVFGLPKQEWSTDTLTSEEDYLTLYKRHYESQVKELTDVNLVLVEAKAYLNESDINRLDFRIPIYIQSPYGSAYFKLLKVEYSDASTPASVTLQKIVLPDTNIKQSLK